MHYFSFTLIVYKDILRMIVMWFFSIKIENQEKKSSNMKIKTIFDFTIFLNFVQISLKNWTRSINHTLKRVPTFSKFVFNDLVSINALFYVNKSCRHFETFQITVQPQYFILIHRITCGLFFHIHLHWHPQNAASQELDFSFYCFKRVNTTKDTDSSFKDTWPDKTSACVEYYVTI